MQSSPKLPGIPGTALLYLTLPHSLPFCWQMLCTPKNSAIFTPVPFAKFHMSTTKLKITHYQFSHLEKNPRLAEK
jgi:hypothetical protein